MPTEELFGAYHFFDEADAAVGRIQPYGSFNFNVETQAGERPSLGAGLNAIVFEPNSEPLWAKADGFEFKDSATAAATPVYPGVYVEEIPSGTQQAGRGNAVAVEMLVLQSEGFEGKSVSDAYFVKCDAETTTQATSGVGDDGFLF